jgi:hypothetical protein
MRLSSILFILALFVSCTGQTDVSTQSIKTPDYLCSARAKGKQCSVWAVAPSRKRAKQAALSHCMYSCGRECRIDFCEVLKDD